jgi:glutathione synthase/RimK-type ligase-like ATP-grasp enzyme
MCQGPAALDTLRGWEAAGVRVINSTVGIANTHRARMLAAFERHQIAQPTGRLLRTEDTTALPEWIGAGAWLKRGDVHATEPNDVVRVDGRSAALDALAAMRQRGIGTALVQRHVDGEVFKFYAVRGRFFASFAPPETAEALSETAAHAMRELAEAGARALDLEVFGGDCVRDRQQNLWLIDLNEWPSYARCRFAAAEAIASYLINTAGAKP